MWCRAPPSRRFGSRLLHAGVFVPAMPSFTRTATIDAPPSRVFATLTDLDQAPLIMPDLVKVEPLTPGPLAKGHQWRETRRMKILGFIPLRTSATIEVDDIVPERRYRTVADDGCNRAAYTFDLSPTDRGKQTKVQLLGEFKCVGKHEGNEKMAARMARFCEKADGDLLERLKAHVESSAVAQG